MDLIEIGNVYLTDNDDDGGERTIKDKSRECKCGGDDQEMVLGREQGSVSFNYRVLG